MAELTQWQIEARRLAEAYNNAQYDDAEDETVEALLLQVSESDLAVIEELLNLAAQALAQKALGQSPQ